MRDLASNTTILVSRESGAAGAGGEGGSLDPAISADGRFVAFSSNARNLSAEDDDQSTDVFVRDLAQNTTVLVSRATGPTGVAGDATSFLPSISADGRLVAFGSEADNLSPESDDGVSNVFVRDLVSGTTTLVSRAGGPAGPAGDADSGTPSISADGRSVAFVSTADNLSTADSDAVFNIFVRDLFGHTTTLVSRVGGTAGTGGDASSFNPSISADGRLVTFESEADNLSGADNDAVGNVFVRDLAAGTTTLASRATGAAGPAADGGSSGPSISADGRFLVFSSEADNLSTADNDGGIIDVFRRDLLGPPTPPDVPAPPPTDRRAVDLTAPVISNLSLARRRFRVGRSGPRGTAFRFRLSEAARVSFLIERCRRPTGRNRRARRCVRHLPVGRFLRPGASGRNRVRFSGRIRRGGRLRALAAGRYRATLSATDPAGNRSRTRRVRFTIVAP